MNILEALIKLRDDLKTWVTINLQVLNKKIDEKTFPIDEELDSLSTNPVQNKTIKRKIDYLTAEVDNVHNSYGNMEDAPNITSHHESEFIVTDDRGNIILKIDASGLSTTGLKLTQMVYTEDEQFALVDKNHNIIFEVTENGAATTSLVLKGQFGKDFIQSFSKDFLIADNDGNIIFKADEEGIHSTELFLNNKKIGEAIERLSSYVGNKPLNQQILEALEASLGDYAEGGGVSTSTANLNISELLPEEFVITDDYGNIIFKADAQGAHAPAMTVHGHEVPGLIASTTDLTEGVSYLASGTLYVVYE